MPLGSVSVVFLQILHTLCILCRRDAKILFKLPGKMMYCGILQGSSDLGERVFALPNHILAFLQLDPANVFSGTDVQML